jgi:hypothetical protein
VISTGTNKGMKNIKIKNKKTVAKMNSFDMREKPKILSQNNSHVGSMLGAKYQHIPKVNYW